jgi:hypothetical protein
MGNLKDEELEQLARAKIMEQKVTSTNPQKYVGIITLKNIEKCICCDRYHMHVQ